MSLFQSLFLGFVQGITEFLPVSSSGHLVVFQDFFNLASLPLFFDVLLHVATLGVVVLFFRKEIRSMVRMCCAPAQWRSSADVRMFMFVFLGSIPTALIGFFAKDYFEQFFHSTAFTGWMFFVTAGLLASTSLRKSAGHGIMAIKPYSAILIGCIQGLALFPGISRSGATISLAIILGWERKTAFTFSFLLFTIIKKG